MGDHYAPRKYLRGFCEKTKPGHIWVYDRLAKKQFKTAVENVAQENGFYHPDDEKMLNTEVEIRANPILDKLREGGRVEEADRQPLAVYIATLLYRVPHARAMAMGVAPEALSATIQETRELVLRAGEEQAISSEMVQQRLKEVDAFEEMYRGGYPPAVMDRIRSPWPTINVVLAIFDMHWRVVTATGSSYFLTSDNPAFFFHGQGLGNPESEFSFPLSSERLLHGSWQKTRQTASAPIPQQLVKEFNRRTASRSTRFLFYHEWQDWIAALGDKKEDHHHLSRVVWTG